jgi:hypothetical protein
MPPVLALSLCLFFIFWLFRRDRQLNGGVSHALWIPLTWITLIGSRFPSEWLAGPASTSTSAYLEGSSLDRNVFLGLILLGCVVLMKRGICWGEFFRKNIFIVLFFTYTGLSILWSDFPLVAFKRWHKVLGHVVMALIVLTDEHPGRAFEALFRRCAYILMPLSFVTIKYYPEISRGFDAWTGEAYNAGITVGKNALGNASMIVGLFLIAVVFASRPRAGAGKLDRAADFAVVFMTGWLLNEAHSATSLGCLILGGVVIVGMKGRFLAHNLSAIVVTVALFAVLLDAAFNVRDAIIVGLGRDTTLTGRTELWESLGRIPVNPIIGVGFESFWLGERVEGLWNKYWWKPNQAHNGYYEMYLNLGYLGVFCQLGMMLAAFMTAKRKIDAALPSSTAGGSGDFALAQFGVAFLIALAAYNFTEASFKALHLSFFVFFLVGIEYPVRQPQAAATTSATRWRSGSPTPRPAAAAMSATPRRVTTAPVRVMPTRPSGSAPQLDVTTGAASDAPRSPRRVTRPSHRLTGVDPWAEPRYPS